MGILTRLVQRLRRLSMRAKIVIGNSLVILTGAIAGTLVTRHFASQAQDIWLILLFTLVGVLLSVAVNTWIVRAALRPLDELRQFVDEIGEGKRRSNQLVLLDADPDIQRLSEALNAMIQQLEANNLQLRAISQRAINAQEEERKRIAQALHDDTGQALSTLIFQLERLERQVPVEQGKLTARLGAARQLAAGCLASLREIVSGLRPAILDDLGLAPAIRWYARSNLEEAGIQVDVQAPEEALPISPEVETTLFRIAQEAVNNIRRHSQARKAVIRLGRSAKAVELCIEDDGRGFALAQTQEAVRLRQWGLVGIQERVDLVGGIFSITSEPERGTRLLISAPLTASEE
jgi:two-component system sensor histidine kinase UhpB